MDKEYILSAKEKEALEKMANRGANMASISLSKLINQEMKLVTLTVRTLVADKIVDILGEPTDIVTAITMKLKGDVMGSIALVYPEKAAFNVADILAKRPLGATTNLDGLDVSALKESGNIIAGAFLAAISDYLSINMVESVPSIMSDTLKATINSMTTEFKGDNGSNAVAYEIDFEISTTNTVGADKVRAFFVLLLDTDSAAKVMASLSHIFSSQTITK